MQKGENKEAKDKLINDVRIKLRKRIKAVKINEKEEEQR